MAWRSAVPVRGERRRRPVVLRRRQQTPVPAAAPPRPATPSSVQPRELRRKGTGTSPEASVHDQRLHRVEVRARPARRCARRPGTRGAGSGRATTTRCGASGQVEPGMAGEQGPSGSVGGGPNGGPAGQGRRPGPSPGRRRRHRASGAARHRPPPPGPEHGLGRGRRPGAGHGARPPAPGGSCRRWRSPCRRRPPPWVRSGRRSTRPRAARPSREIGLGCLGGEVDHPVERLDGAPGLAGGEG